MIGKGILLAGGSGSRMYPLTLAVNKQLLPIYDKPLVYYPLSTLMLAGIRDVLVITNPLDQQAFQRLLGDGSQFGIAIRYATQSHPRGLADAFRIGREFIGDDSVALALGDNLFYGHGFAELLAAAAQREVGATIFAQQVNDPQRYGVVQVDAAGRAVGLEEKPANPRSPYATAGLYFYDNRVVQVAADLQPSPRGELEITDVNRWFLDRQQLHVQILGRGLAWLDAGTHQSMAQAAQFVESVEQRQGLKICCPEEIAYRLGYVTSDQLAAHVRSMQSPYGDYLRQLLTS